jgi:crotonobetainyl-CoA:carnitine CoA-transferase CaiB-like acyl-CoA transferase
MTADGLLSGVRVLDVTTGIAGPGACLLLAEAGADVVKVEHPTGHLRDRERAGFLTWNRSKRSIVLDPGADTDRRTLEDLLAAADVLVHELPPSEAAARGLDDAALAERHPHLVVCSVLGWPADHPDAERPTDELLAMARLGVLDEQFAMRRDGPVFVRFPLGSWCAAYLAAIGILARLRARPNSGRGGAAHTSLVQGALVPLGMLWSRATTPSESLAIGMPKATRGSQATLFECADGAWLHLMGDPTRSPGFAAQLTAGEAMADVFTTRTCAEWLDELCAHDVAVAPALPFGAILDDEQARANDYVVEVDDPRLGRVTMPGNPLTTTPPCTVRGAAPEAGADCDAVLAEWAARPAPPVPAATRTSLRWPLEGLNVVDLGAFLAGPYGPLLLGDLGAEVVKVESTTGDGMRPVEWAFAGCQRGKRSVALDLKAPSARPALDALLRWADVVHLNIRMPAARRLGLGPQDVLTVNPRAVYCHTSSYGPTGPQADWPGYDQLFQALCGWEVLGAGEGNPPMWHRFGFMDHLCAMASVVATLLALRRRDETGEGQVVAASLLGAGVLTTGEAVRLADGSLTPVATVDADQTGLSAGYRIERDGNRWVAVVDLGEAGIVREPVREDQRDPFFDDAANRTAGLVATYDHPVWGRLDQPGALWTFGDLGTRIERPPPLLGQHTAEVLTEVGMAADAVAELVAAGVAVDSAQ